MRSSYIFGLFGLWICGTMVCKGLELPDTSGIDREFIGNHSVDQFFSLWIVFNNDDGVQISDKPFTIFAPKNRPEFSSESFLSYPDKVKDLLADHVVLGQKLRLDEVAGAFHFKTSGGRIAGVQLNEGNLYVNGARVLDPRIDVPGGGVVVVLEDYLFSKAGPSGTTESSPTTVPASVEDSNDGSNSTFFQNLVDLLSFFKTGVRVFQSLLSRSNVSQLLKNDEEYTVLIPTDRAFQRWHPIDWGFYPFSVPEFTETVIVNHFVPGNIRVADIKDGLTVKTLGSREIFFTKTPLFVSANGAPLVGGDTPIHRGNLIFVSEVLFMSEAEVQKLHQQNKDKETPPLLAFPWFGAQFLSHAFLALERQRRFSHITRFLNLADLAPHVSGKGYTFFVPTDEAFEALGLGTVPDNHLSTGRGLDLLLNHFVKGRLYERELLDGIQLTTLGNKTIKVSNKSGVIHVNEAKIIENEVFVYNLGTMFYVDRVLFRGEDDLSVPATSTIPESSATTTFPAKSSAKPEAEKVPEELTEEVGTLTDVLLQEDGTTDPPVASQSEKDSEEEISTEFFPPTSTDYPESSTVRREFSTDGF